MPKSSHMATPRSSRTPLLQRVQNRITAIRDGMAGRSLPPLAIAMFSIVLLIVLGLQLTLDDDTLHAPEHRELATASEWTTAAESSGVDDRQESSAELIEPLDIETTQQPSWSYVQIASGDTLEVIFRRLGLSPALLHEIANIEEYGRELTRIRPGDEFAFDISPEGQFHALRTEYGDDQWLFVEQSHDGLIARTEPRLLEVRTVEIEAEITSSLFNAAKNAGLSDNMTLRLASIFAWDIDFALDIRRGDRFALVYEEIYREGQFLRQGSILAARFINQGDSFEAIRFDAGDGPDFYDPEGRPMRKAFLRAPLNFTRVTSNFNPRRFHPVTRRVRPHNGTDYGGPVGTPIWAAGDGRVTESAYNNINGHYVFIQHGNHIVTKYLHLSKRHVNIGDRVRQGQTIGLLGATGRVTGPHLHYEFLVNGRHRNPRTVDLPVAQPLGPEILPDYRRAAGPLLIRLEELLPPKVLLASSTSAG
ncbi:MAG: peptidoglycan DD-metalloendopeptidase family protein [Pseudomonadota bacterium]